MSNEMRVAKAARIFVMGRTTPARCKISMLFQESAPRRTYGPLAAPQLATPRRTVPIR